MKCPNCGKENKAINKFCTKCGMPLPKEQGNENQSCNGRMPGMSSAVRSFNSFEEEKTLILDDFDSFEDEKTVVLDDCDRFENEKTVVLDDCDSFEEEKTAVLDDCDSGDNSVADFSETTTFDDETTVIIQEPGKTSPPEYTFNYRSVYKDHYNDNQDTAYIDHLRKLKGLLDDGIITEEEFVQKKKQILGI